MICACAKPTFKLPKRLERARRVAESRRIDSFKTLHENLKKTAQEEKQMVQEFVDKFKAFLDDDDDENNVEIV